MDEAVPLLSVSSLDLRAERVPQSDSRAAALATKAAQNTMMNLYTSPLANYIPISFLCASFIVLLPLGLALLLGVAGRR